jgi:ubiquitin-protein ligase
MNPRLKRLQSDYDRISKDFSDHPYIKVRPLIGDPPEAYEVLYHLDGLRMDGNVTASQYEHIIRIALPAGYPRVKPVCTIQTPIWHPNFRDGQICIGDIWGAGETVSDIIVHIGDMIQYRIWNSKSPLSADAAHWALANKNIFPLGNAELWKPEIVPDAPVEIPEKAQIIEPQAPAAPIPTTDFQSAGPAFTAASVAPPFPSQPNDNDFEITSDELRDVKWSPTPIQPISIGTGSSFEPQSTYQQNTTIPRAAASRKKMDFGAVFRKGVLFGLIGGAVAWGLNEIINPAAPIYQYAYENWDSFTLSDDYMLLRIGTGVFNAMIAGLICLVLAFGEEKYRGAQEGIAKNVTIRLFIGAGLGFIGGFIAQAIYTNILTSADTESISNQIFARSIAWIFMGLSVGLSQGLYPKNKKRILNGLIGGSIGGFLGGLAFDIIGSLFTDSMNDSAVISRAIAITLIGGLTGLGIGLVEQLTKQAWFKVVRGDFEGKEFILHQPIVRIGATSPSHIVLFKDKLVSPVHAEIRLEKGKHILVDQGSANGTFVNGMRVPMQTLREGDMLVLGNTAMVYHVKEVRP